MKEQEFIDENGPENDELSDNENLPAFKNYSGITESLKTVLDSIRPYSALVNDLRNTGIFSIAESIKEALKPIADFQETYFRTISESLREFATFSQNLLNAIQIPSITAERKQHLIEGYTAWGKFGWTMIPSAAMDLFEDAPETKKQANEIALSLFRTHAQVENLFSDIRGCSGIKKSDLEEAIFDFQHRQWKSCAMILYAMIDSKLIRMQPKLPKQKRKSGSGGVWQLKTKLDEKTSEAMLITTLQQVNLVACLLTLFADGKDFVEQPDVLNRNFVDHGMLYRHVKRMDCIQLFLALYNLNEIMKFL